LFLAVASCFFLSGFAALVYQTAWTREFGLVFGTSELAIATVLATYMAGLAFGAWLAEFGLARVNRPILIYSVLELSVGATALVWVPAVLFAAQWLLRALFGHQPAPPGSSGTGLAFFFVIASFLAIGVPATLMGATLPILVGRLVRTDGEIGPRVGVLYAVNTFGAMIGALVAAFWLLPTLGLTKTIWFAAAVNGLVCLAAILISRNAQRKEAYASRETNADRHTRFLREVALEHSGADSYAPLRLLPLILIAGAVALFHEVFWSRLLTHIVGSSIYAFGVMVASFLAGIVLGSLIGAAIARDRRVCLAALGVSQLLAAVSAAGAYFLIDRIVPRQAGLLSNAWFGFTLLLPLTISIGIGYPLAVRVLADKARDAAQSSARVYAWNTVGCIAGALLAAFLLIPTMKYEGAIRVAVATSAALAVAFFFLLKRGRRQLLATAVIAGVAVFFAFRPPAPNKLLVTSPLNVPGDGRIVYYDVGRTASVVVLQQDGGLLLRTNGLPEALVEGAGSPPKFSGEFWLSPLAVIARPNTQSMLIVGYGGGGTVEGVPPSVRRVDVIELEPQVIEAARATRKLRKYDPLSDRRVNIITNDARAALNLTDRKYDAVVSQPSHPWTAGASHLYTREFMQQARAHLTDGGVFVQWMNVNFLDRALLRSFSATILSVFEHVRLYRPDPNTLVFVASSRPLNIEQQLAETGDPLRIWTAHYGRFGINTVEDLVAALAAEAPEIRAFAKGAPIITDDDNRIATSSVYELGRGLTPAAATRALAPFDPLTHPGSETFRALKDRLSFDYIARRLAVFAAIDSEIPRRLQNLAVTLGNSAEGDLVHAIALRSAGNNEEAEQSLEASLGQFPDDGALRFEYVRPYLGAFARGTAPDPIVAEISNLDGPPVAILKAEAFAARNQWKELGLLDPELANAEWTDPWKFEALRLQIDWRTHAPPQAVGSLLGDEALALVDRAIVVQPTLALYELRARGALAAGRGDALVESIWSYGEGLYTNGMRLPVNERAETKANLELLIKLLDTPTVGGRSDSGRIAEVREKLEHAARKLGQA
jgi:spermidine synthase